MTTLTIAVVCCLAATTSRAEPETNPKPATPAARPALRLRIAVPSTRALARPETSTEAPADATHEQVDVIRPTQGDPAAKLASFCLTKDGRIVTVVTIGGAAGAPAEATSAPAPTVAAAAGDTAEPVCEVRVMDGDGKLVETWPIDFHAQAVNVGPEGDVYVGGDGLIARFDSHGKLLAKAEAPHVVASREDPEALDRQARELVEQQTTSLSAALTQVEEQLKQLDAKDEASLTDEEKLQKQNFNAMATAYKRAIEANGATGEAKEQQIEQMKRALAGRQRTINAIAASDKYIYITCSASKGFGYSVWRAGHDFSSPQMIVDGLRGCCGQMDVQCGGGELYVAENSRHRVVRFDADGNEVKAWGKRERDGQGECFGGCCNPMNTRLAGDKLYVAESDGQVKLFTPEGEYLGLVGKAAVQPGCKSSIVEVSPDGDRVYYIDVQNSAICVLAKKSADTPAAQ